jgi:ribonuclease HI
MDGVVWWLRQRMVPAGAIRALADGVRCLRFEDGSVEELGGYDPATTNNRMELQAALALLERLKDLPRHPDLTLRPTANTSSMAWDLG